MNEQQARQFAEHWITAWNSHDLDAILSHYADDVEYFSIFLTRLADHPAGRLQGKAAVRAYLAKALVAYPELQFELRQVFWGVRSVVLHYRSVNNLLAAEVFELDAQGQVCRVQCHYDQ